MSALDVQEIPLPDGIGLEGTDISDARLVGSAEHLLELSYLIKSRLRGAAPLPALLDTTLVVDARREADEWKGRYDELLAAVLSGRLTTAAALDTAHPGDAATTVAAAPRPTSPAERGDGPCPLAGCSETGAHVHRFWQTAKANGRLTGDVAERWSVQQWSDFLRAHELSQRDAIKEMAAWAEARGEDAPAGLASVKGRRDLATVLLALAERTEAAARAGVEPW